MASTFKEIRKLQGERVRMQFDDGREVVAVLLCATKDMDGSKHLIYDKVESDAPEHAPAEHAGCFYADARTLVHIEHADARKRPQAVRARVPISVAREAAKSSPRAWRPSA
jgi:hypothetical protein